MLRAWFILIFTLGILSSALSNCGGRLSEAPESLVQVKANQGPGLVQSSDYPGDSAPTGDGGVTLQRQPDGHFYADVQINNSTVRMLVDTGASGIALTRDDARRAGIGISIGMPNVVGQGAGGEVKGEYVTLDQVSLGDESASAVHAIVLDGGGQSLLGQSFLGQFASVEIKGDKMVLR